MLPRYEPLVRDALDRIEALAEQIRGYGTTPLSIHEMRKIGRAAGEIGACTERIRSCLGTGDGRPRGSGHG